MLTLSVADLPRCHCLLSGSRGPGQVRVSVAQDGNMRRFLTYLVEQWWRCRWLSLHLPRHRDHLPPEHWSRRGRRQLPPHLRAQQHDRRRLVSVTFGMAETTSDVVDSASNLLVPSAFPTALVVLACSSSPAAPTSHSPLPTCSCPSHPTRPT